MYIGYLIPSISHITMVYTVEPILVIVDFFGLTDKSKVAKQTWYLISTLSNNDQVLQRESSLSCIPV